jgi:hypothetical protein
MKRARQPAANSAARTKPRTSRAMPSRENISEDSCFIYKLVNPADNKREILTLLSQVFEMDFDQAEFEWYKLKHPHSMSRVYFALERLSERPAGVICSQTFTYRIGSENQQISLLVSGGTHPNFRRIGVFGKLANVIVGHESRLGVQCSVTFPNPYLRQSFPAFMKAGWQVPVEYRFLEKRQFRRSSGTAVRVERFDQRFDALSQEAAKSFDFFQIKDHRTLNWRYTERPSTRYDCFAAGESDVKGLIVLKKLSTPDSVKAHIVDFMALTHDVADQLISVAENYARETSSLNVVLTTSNAFESLFLEHGFTVCAERFPVVMKSPSAAKIPRFSAPWVALGDNDVY